MYDCPTIGVICAFVERKRLRFETLHSTRAYRPIYDIFKSALIFLSASKLLQGTVSFANLRIQIKNDQTWLNAFYQKGSKHESIHRNQMG